MVRIGYPADVRSAKVRLSCALPSPRRPMIRWFSRMPLTLRLPLAVAAMIFLVSTGTTQLAIQVSSNQFERQMERIGQVYLDGLSAALVPAAAGGDGAAMTGTLRQALTVHVGVEDRRLVVLDAERRIIAQADRLPTDPERQAAAGPAPSDWPAAIATRSHGSWFDAADRSIWVWRPLGGGAGGTVAALLDLTGFVSDRERLRWSLLGVDLLVSAACALLGFGVARQLQQPVTLLTEHLRLGIGQSPRPIDAAAIPVEDPEIAGLIRAFNRMASDAGERETMLSRMVEQDREAVLGRMAATLAHEVRNPLGGMTASIQTLRRFGDRTGSPRRGTGFPRARRRGAPRGHRRDAATPPARAPRPGGCIATTWTTSTGWCGPTRHAAAS